MSEPGVYMAMLCPGFGESRYSCKVAGVCDCGKDDDMFAAYERQCSWRALRPVAPMMLDPDAPTPRRYATETPLPEPYA